jgi:hypothetical protein
MKMKGMKEFTTKQAAMKYANKTYKQYGYDASVYKLSKKGKQTKYATIDPRKLKMTKIR